MGSFVDVTPKHLDIAERKFTMDIVVLVIGNVTPAECASVRLELVNKGYKPKLVHKTKEDVFLSTNELIDFATFDEKATLERLAGVKSSEDDLDEEYLEILSGIARRHVRSLGPIAAVIFDEDAWDWLGTRGWFTKNSLETDSGEHIARWVVRNGITELVG